MTLKKHLHILGVRGIPARHGGFESFAENLSLYLVKQGWAVTVYCQEDLQTIKEITRDQWKGVNRVRIPIKPRGNLTSIIFDWRAIQYAVKGEGVFLILGYNTALFAAWLRWKKKTVLFNMDGLEWKRSKWPLHAKLWFYINEWLGAWLGNHLIADHPRIDQHLRRRVFGQNKITMIAYGARTVKTGDEQVLFDRGLTQGHYALVVARPVPENHVFEIVRAWSSEKCGCKLVVLGALDQDVAYHQAIIQAAGDEVILMGGVYDPHQVDALRFGARFYIHGHSVGGTNPSLVEALGAGNAILAHDNPFNRWVAGQAGLYFKNEYDLRLKIDQILSNASWVEGAKKQACQRHSQSFQWDGILKTYEELLTRFL